MWLEGRRIRSLVLITTPLITAMLLAATCRDDAPKGVDLSILGPASQFRVIFAQPPPDTQFRLKLAIANFSNDPAGGDIANFDAACEVFASDFDGGTRRSNSKIEVSNIAVKVFGTTEVNIDFSRHEDSFLITPYYFIDCVVDPTKEVAELNEENNQFGFVFRAYCLNSGDPCPGPFQQGGSLSHVPAK